MTNNSVNSAPFAAYGSWTKTASDPSSTDYFHTGSVDANVTAVGIVYTNSDGRFTVDEDGKYEISCCLYIETGNAHSIQVKINGTQEWVASTYVHTSVDPIERSIRVILDLSAGDYINIESSVSITTRAGTTCNIIRIA